MTCPNNDNVIFLLIIIHAIDAMIKILITSCFSYNSFVDKIYKSQYTTFTDKVKELSV